MIMRLRKLLREKRFEHYEYPAPKKAPKKESTAEVIIEKE
jgi:hypothetical protein